MSYYLFKARANEIIKDSLNIKNLEDRVLFLIRAKAKFTSENSGSDVPLIVSIYDGAIDETKFLIQQRQSATQGEKAKNIVNGNTITSIAELLESFKTLDFHYSDITEPPFRIEFLQFKYYNEAKELEKLIKTLYLEGNDKALIKIKVDLKQSKTLLEDFDAGLIAHDENGVELFVISPEEVKQINGFKINYIDNLINVIDVYMSTLTATDIPEAPLSEPETTEQKIKRILEPNRWAFNDNTHIETIIEAFINLKIGGNLPKIKKEILQNMGISEFIKPFGRLFAEGIFGRGEIAQTLLYYIKKKTFAGDPEYSEGYINRLLSEYKSKP